MSALPTPSANDGPALQLRTGEAPLTCTTIPLERALAWMRDEWRELSTAIAAGPTWCEAWSTTIGADQECLMHVTRDGIDIIGALPLTIGTIAAGPITLRAARLAALRGTAATGGLAAHPEWTVGVVEQLLESTLGDERCDAVQLGPIAGSAQLDAVRDALLLRPDIGAIVRERPGAAEMTITLDGDWRQSCLSRSHRSQLGKMERRLAKLGRVVHSVVDDPELLVPEFNAFCEMHKAQWMLRGEPGHFVDWPQATEFHRTLLQGGHGFIHRIAVDDHVLARQLVLHEGDRAMCRLSARASGSMLERACLGQQSLAGVLDVLDRRGIRTAELGPAATYKERMGAVANPAATITIASHRTSSRFRAQAYGAVGDAIDTVYYRAWRKRIAPRLAQRFDFELAPLRRCWIGSR